jgi:hypothetical protein
MSEIVKKVEAPPSVASFLAGLERYVANPGETVANKK